MPTYLYECPDYGEFEVDHSINTELEECPKCKEAGRPQHKPKRLIAGGGNFILVGGGWAKEGYSTK